MSGDSQFIRRWALFVYGNDGNGQAIADGTDEPGHETLRIHFSLQQAAAGGIPNRGLIRIWNPPPDVLGKVKLYTRVQLQAGYKDGAYGTIFDGTTWMFEYGYENAVDSYLNLYIQDGDLAMVHAVVNKTLMPGANDYASKTKVLTDTMAPLGTTYGPPAAAAPGNTGQSGGFPGGNPRPEILYGMTVDDMTLHTKNFGQVWTIEDGKIKIYDDGITPGVGIILNAQSGLIGWPTVTPDGIKAKCLLNPQIRIRSRIKLDNASINRVGGTGDKGPGLENTATTPAPPQIQFFAPISADGEYVAFVVEHTGDSRGTEWYTNLMLWGVEAKSGKWLLQSGQVPTDAVIAAEATGSPAASPGGMAGSTDHPASDPPT